MSSGSAGPTTHSQYPITTGTSIFGLRYKDGIIIAADTSGNYGNLARYPKTQRVFKVNDTTVIASSGDIADFQYLHKIIKSKQNEEDIRGGGVSMRPEALHCWLTRVLYNRRSKFDPLWNSILVGGMQEGKPFLGCVDMIGTAWQENAIATGIGAAMAIPIINHEMEKILLRALDTVLDFLCELDMNMHFLLYHCRTFGNYVQPTQRSQNSYFKSHFSMLTIFHFVSSTFLSSVRNTYLLSDNYLPKC
jgi:20S proteasome alpha/beta subunit